MFVQGILSLACLLQVIQAFPATQQPIKPHPHDNVQNVRAEFKKAEIIPTVIDDFLPSLSLSISWKKRTAKLGNTIKPKHLQSEPTITLYDETTSSSSKPGITRKQMQYVITLTDPDAPSRDDPEWSEMCHWIASNVSIATKAEVLEEEDEEEEEGVFKILPLPRFGLSDTATTNNKHPPKHHKSTSLSTIMPYKPPGPPPKTGKHRYVFLVFAPKNGTSEVLNPSKPEERKHWGTGKVRGGVRSWAEDNGLVPVAGNFVYAKNKKQ